LFNIFLHCKRNEVIKHDHTQTAVAHDWRNQSSWNKYGHAAKVTTYALIYINEVLHYQFVHRKISTLTFGTYMGRPRTRWFSHKLEKCKQTGKRQQLCKMENKWNWRLFVH